MSGLLSLIIHILDILTGKARKRKKRKLLMNMVLTLFGFAILVFGGIYLLFLHIAKNKPQEEEKKEETESDFVE